ncbi:hypothetical protein OE88DRAFT_1167160 [Heliocybe sulcata]|uniref:Uncharacterized protein n=1 Tax=Heliocybe sulcata TaxID=5364 RepID=A0A5C3NCU9_9AGAM|nr:hypothetical protein OE88DRAFT_1167160 [Heliocybe sulcata]
MMPDLTAKTQGHIREDKKGLDAGARHPPVHQSSLLRSMDFLVLVTSRGRNSLRSSLRPRLASLFNADITGSPGTDPLDCCDKRIVCGASDANSLSRCSEICAAIRSANPTTHTTIQEKPLVHQGLPELGHYPIMHPQHVFKFGLSTSFTAAPSRRLSPDNIHITAFFPNHLRLAGARRCDYNPRLGWLSENAKNLRGI